MSDAIRVDVPGGDPVELPYRPLQRYRDELATWPEVAPVRLAYAAAHVVMHAGYAASKPGDAIAGAIADDIADEIDWQTTAALRQRLASLGFAIAEAMDTAQRFQLGWPAARRLIEQCGALELAHGFVAGAGTDQSDEITSRGQLVDNVVEQARLIQAAGGEVILLPIPWLASNDTDEQGYVDVYAAIIGQLEGPVYVHWLGEQFLPALRGYFPGDSFERVMDIDPAVVRGAKLSLLDARKELTLRRRLARNQQLMLTGDDFHFARLIAGGDLDGPPAIPTPDGWIDLGGRRTALGDFSHALLGILDGIAEPASVALRYLGHGRLDRYLELMEPAERLARVVFEAPTQHYKAGLAFLAWLGGHQDNPMLVGHAERARDRDHYLRVVRLAATARVFGEPTITAARLESWLASEAHHHRRVGRPR